MKPRHDHEDPERCGPPVHRTADSGPLQNSVKTPQDFSANWAASRCSSSNIGRVSFRKLRRDRSPVACMMASISCKPQPYALGFSCRSARRLQGHIFIFVFHRTTVSKTRYRHTSGLYSCADVRVESRVHGALARSSKGTASPGNQAPRVVVVMPRRDSQSAAASYNEVKSQLK